MTTPSDDAWAMDHDRNAQPNLFTSPPVPGGPPPGPYLSDAPHPVDYPTPAAPPMSAPPGPFFGAAVPQHVSTGPVSEYRESWLRRTLRRLRDR